MDTTNSTAIIIGVDTHKSKHVAVAVSFLVFVVVAMIAMKSEA